MAASETLPAAEGIVHQQQTLAGHGGERVTLHFLSFDESRYAFRMLDQEPGTQSSLEEILRKNHCLAGTNGGFFRPDFDPLGLLMCDGKVVQPVSHARLLSGALIVTDKKIEFRRSTRPLPGRHARQAVQSGPFLVENGQVVAGLNNERSAPRTAAFTDGARRWGLVSASALTLAELGRVLADPALLPGGMKISGALNLDGGHSTAMWSMQPGKEPFYLREEGLLRDFVGIVPRAEARK